mgnify:CR=1 FL=1
MGHGHHIEIKQETFVMPAKGKNFAMILMILGLVLAGIGIANIDRKSSSNHEETAKVESTASANEHEAMVAVEEHGKAEETEEIHNIPNEKFLN